MNVSLSTHLFAFHDLDEAIFPLFPRYGFSLAEIWAMPPHFPSGDFPAADGVARQMAEHGIRVASVHAPCTRTSGRTRRTDGTPSPPWTRRTVSSPSR